LGVVILFHLPYNYRRKPHPSISTYRSSSLRYNAFPDVLFYGCWFLKLSRVWPFVADTSEVCSTEIEKESTRMCHIWSSSGERFCF